MENSRPAEAVSPAVDLTTYDAVILDFDGPMCNVFANYPVAAITENLKRLLVANGWQHEALPTTSDPHQIVRLVQCQVPMLAPQIEAALSAAEFAAVATATETPGLANLLAAAQASRISVAVASNNNAVAIRRWLDRQGYEIQHVVGRDPSDASRMKPEPDALVETISLLGVEADRAVFLGDAATDAQAAWGAGCSFVALANKPHKMRLFQDLGCTAIVTNLGQLNAQRSSAPHN